ncbi:MAG: 50S ribosomal protein L21 [Flavobacteriaceae bacterium]
MYAIVEMAGQQFKVAKDQKVYVHRLQEEEGKKVTFNNVLLIEDGKNITIGAPAIDGAAVEAKVVKHLKGDKVIVFKKKRRKGYKTKNGHRQYLTELVIESIVAKGAKKAAPKKEAAKKPAKPAAAKKEEVKASAPKKAAEPKAKAAPKKEAAKPATDLSKHTVAELKEMAKAKGIEGISSMKKADLIAALSKK